jgi:hypothetical protein
MMRGMLFDFFGTLVQYSPSRRSQGYEKTHRILKARKIELSYTSFPTPSRVPYLLRTVSVPICDTTISNRIGNGYGLNTMGTRRRRSTRSIAAPCAVAWRS